MQYSTLLAAAVLALAPLASAHARIKYPTPLGNSGDNSYNAPLKADGSDFPCKGLHTTFDSAESVASWSAGSSAHFEIQNHDAPEGVEGSLAAHSGGSCQASISYDGGKTFKVLRSFEGGCPRGVSLNSNLAGPDQIFDFDIPAEAKSGDALFAWTWTAVSGNRDEFYMNCAKVTIEGSGTSTLGDLPDMYVGDMTLPGVVADGECRSTAGSALKYPNAGSNAIQDQVSGIEFKEPSAGVCALVSSGSSTPEQTTPEETTPEETTPEETTPEETTPEETTPEETTPQDEPESESGDNSEEQPTEQPTVEADKPITLEINGKMCSITCQ